MRVIIVGSGQSARGFVPPSGVTVIAVNGAIEWVKRADYFFTLDPSEANMYRLSHQRIGVKYCYAFDHLLNVPNAEYYQRIAGKPFENPEQHTAKWWCNRWGCVLGLSKRIGEIHTGNSAWGALGLAYHLGATKVILVGVDASSDERLEGGKPNNLSHLPLLFESALDQVQLVNCGAMKSLVPQMNIREGVSWLMQ